MDRELVGQHDAGTGTNEVRTDPAGGQQASWRVGTTLRLPAERVSARTARHAVRALCAEVPPPPVSDDHVDVAALLTTELVANAVLHTGDAAVLDAAVEDRVLRVAVSDTSTALPRLVARPSSDAVDGSRDEGESGRGLFLVDGLADRWGWHPHGDGVPGKTVWFELDVA